MLNSCSHKTREQDILEVLAYTQ